MATTEQYENAARRLNLAIREAEPSEKQRLMHALGNVRFSEYRETQDPRCRRLAANCYLAARSFHYR